MLDTDHHLWTLSKGGPRNLGLSCDADGLFLGRTPLLQRTAGLFAPRPQAELQRLLTRGFGIPVQLERLMFGLQAVASALNANDICRARIAAVQLRVPDLPDALARLDMQLEDVQLKLGRADKTTAAGDWNPRGGGWDPDEHPRTGTPPNPGWFAPTDGGGDDGIRPALASDNPSDDGKLHLPPGERNDEIGDLLEWISNAKPEDAQAIRGEIQRQFYAVGDFADGFALQHALSKVLANPDTTTRQEILDGYEPITHRDPVVVGQLLWGMALGTVGSGGRFLGSTLGASEEAASEFWALGWAARGQKIEDALTADAPETRMPPNFPVIDQWANGVATSIKSIDLAAATYQDASRLGYRINDYIAKLADFDGASYGEDIEVRGEDIKSRVLNLVVPKGSITSMQKSALDAAINRANDVGVTLKITQF